MEEAIAGSNAAVLLISASFLASDFIQEIELPALLARHRPEGLPLVLVLLRSCNWRAHPDLALLQPLPRDTGPIASLTGGQRAYPAPLPLLDDGRPLPSEEEPSDHLPLLVSFDVAQD